MLRVADNDVPRTWLTVVPLESHCFAARIGFANPFATPMEIAAATMQPSDSYNPVPGSLVLGTTRTPSECSSRPRGVRAED